MKSKGASSRGMADNGKNPVCYREDSIGREIQTENPNNAYILKRVSATSDRETLKLVNEGYHFLDRYFLMEISLNRTAASTARKVVQLSIDETGGFTEEMHLLAQQVFPTDRRFHLEPEFDSKSAAPIIRAYMNYWKDADAVALKIVEQKELLGFTILRRVSDNAYENVLGVTKPGIKGKMAAYPLYNGTLDFIKRQEAEKYIGRVSTTNIPSINLHLRLGSKIASVYDEYILRKE